jgi:hypothetical protein
MGVMERGVQSGGRFRPARVQQLVGQLLDSGDTVVSSRQNRQRFSPEWMS